MFPIDNVGFATIFYDHSNSFSIRPQKILYNFIWFYLQLFLITFKNLPRVGFKLTTSCLPCTRCNHRTIWPNNEMCLMVYIKLGPSSVAKLMFWIYLSIRLLKKKKLKDIKFITSSKYINPYHALKFRGNNHDGSAEAPWPTENQLHPTKANQHF